MIADPDGCAESHAAETPLTHGQRTRSLRTPGFQVVETHHPRGMVLARHEHPRPAVNFVLAGVYAERFRSGDDEFGPQTALYKPGGAEHSNAFLRASACSLLIEMQDEELATESLGFRRPASTRDPRAANLALAVWRELARPDASSALAIDALAIELYERVIGGATRPEGARSRRVLRAMDILHDDPRGAWTLSALAREVGLHPSHLARSFRSHHGCTIGEYLRRLRVAEVARALALGSEPVGVLAQRFGFADQSHCTRVFRAFLGATPAAYRRSFE